MENDALEQVTPDTPATESAAPATAPAPEASAGGTLSDVIGAAGEDTPDAPDAPTPEAATDDTPAPESGDTPDPVDGDASEATTAFDVNIPVPTADGDIASDLARVLKLTVPTQEAHDALQHLVKQATRAPRLEAKLDQYQQDAATVDFLEQSPAEGMLWMAQRQPQAAAQFAAQWLAQNPDFVTSVLPQLGYQVTSELDARTLQLQAENAAYKAQQQLAQSQQQRAQIGTAQQFQATAIESAMELAAQIGLKDGDEDHEAFAGLAADRLAKLFHQNPRANRSDVLTTLQPLANRFLALRNPAARVQATQTPARPNPAPATTPTPPRDDAGRFTAADKAQRLADRNRTMRKVVGGATPVTALGATKLPKGTTLQDAIKAMTGK